MYVYACIPACEHLCKNWYLNYNTMHAYMYTSIYVCSLKKLYSWIIKVRVCVYVCVCVHFGTTNTKWRLGGPLAQTNSKDGHMKSRK